MSRTVITLTLPDGTEAAWHDRFTDRLSLRLGEMLHDLALGPPRLVHSSDGTAGYLSILDQNVPLSFCPDPVQAAEAAFARLHALRWPTLIAPALAARGITPGWWLRHAARRGLDIDDLAWLCKGDSEGDAVAWRLAERDPRALGVLAGSEAIALLRGNEQCTTAATLAASLTGLPIRIPEQPIPDAALDADQARLRIETLRGPGFGAETLADALIAETPAMIDPGLVIALFTDEARLNRRLAMMALRRTGAPRIAKMMIALAEQHHALGDVTALAEAAAGLVADVAPGAVMAPATHGMAAQYAAMALRGFASAS